MLTLLSPVGVTLLTLGFTAILLESAAKGHAWWAIIFTVIVLISALASLIEWLDYFGWPS